MGLQLGIAVGMGGSPPWPQSLETAAEGQLLQRACRARGPRRLHPSGSAAMILNFAFDASSTPPPWSATVLSWIGCRSTLVILCLQCRACHLFMVPPQGPRIADTGEKEVQRLRGSETQGRTPPAGIAAGAKYSDTRHVWMRVVANKHCSSLSRVIRTPPLTTTTTTTTIMLIIIVKHARRVGSMAIVNVATGPNF